MARSQRAQEVDEVLLVAVGQLAEIVDHAVRFRPDAGMLADRLHDVLGAAVMQEEDALADAPQWRGAELPATGGALADIVGEPDTHVVDGEVAVRPDGHVALAGERRVAGGQRNIMTGLAADVREHLLATR